MDLEIHENQKYNKKQFPYFVQYDLNNKTHIRHFLSYVEAVKWADRAKELLTTRLPIGITLDIRQKSTPFLARRKKVGKRYHKYFATLEEAITWLDRSTTT